MADVESLSEVRVADLREQLSKRGLPTNGLKEDLVNRLREAMEKERNISDANVQNPIETSEQEKKIEEQAEQERNESEVNLSQLMAFMMQMDSKIEKGQKRTDAKLEEGQKRTDAKLEEGQKRTDAKFDRMDQKLQEVNSGINSTIEALGEKIETLASANRKMENIEEEIEKKVSEKLGNTFEIPEEIMSAENELQNVQHISTLAKPCIKLSTYDGKTSWRVYKAQFAIVTEANGWDPITKARQLAESLRADAADILGAILEDQRLNFEALSDALELRFGEKCLKDDRRLQLETRQQRPNETPQELATDVERLSHLAFADCPADVRETLVRQYFVDEINEQFLCAWGQVKPGFGEDVSNFACGCEYGSVEAVTQYKSHSTDTVTVRVGLKLGLRGINVTLEGLPEKRIGKTQTTFLHPELDGMVERFDRTIPNHLSLHVSRNQQDWDQELPFFLLVYQIAVHETTGFTPSQMLFGRELRLPCDLLFGRSPDAPSSPEDYINDLQERLESVHEFARSRISIATEKMKTRYDTRATGHEFQEGDKVWFWNPIRRKGLSPKLQSSWEGPYSVLKRLNDVVVRVQKSPNSRPRIVHYDRLAPYYGNT